MCGFREREEANSNESPLRIGRSSVDRTFELRNSHHSIINHLFPCLSAVCTDAGGAGKSEQGQRFHEGFHSPDARDRANAARGLAAALGAGEISDAFTYQPGNPAYTAVCHDLVAASEAFNGPGTFTTFAAFEWAAFEAARTLHRNIIFRDGPEKTLQTV
jgi:hypothetical protein